MRIRTLSTLAVASAVALAAPATALAIDAAAVWNKDCAMCHGKDGAGGTKAGEKLGVKDLTDPAVRAKFDRARMEKGIREGIKDEAGKQVKKPFADKLSAEEIQALLDYVYAFPAKK